MSLNSIGAIVNRRDLLLKLFIITSLCLGSQPGCAQIFFVEEAACVNFVTHGLPVLLTHLQLAF